MKRILLTLFVCGCGVGTPSVPGPELTADTQPPQASTNTPPADECVPEDISSSFWGCDTIAALEVLDVEVSSWTRGQPAQVQVKVRNNTPRFLNYPGIRIDTSAGGKGIEQRYGMWACGLEEMTIQVDALAASPGQAVTFTAVAIAIVQDARCTAAPATLSRTVTAP